MAHGRALDLGTTARLMAIVNVTPDSFSDGGAHASVEQAVDHARLCLAEGADILDIGGESTRPGASPVTAQQEQDRVLPVIERLARDTDALISVDTYRAETARLAISAGAHIINDVYGLQKEPDIAKVASATGAGVCVMHTGRGRDALADVVADQFDYLNRSLEIAQAAGMAPSTIVLDPGFGFAKETVEENLQLMARFEELHAFGYPLLAGTSRKRFLGTLTGRQATERDAATAATSVLLRLKGAAIFRVHNVAINRDVLAVADAMMAAQSLAQEGRSA
nr:dihydropteroate synthase [Agrobacterium sp. a22-2]